MPTPRLKLSGRYGMLSVLRMLPKTTRRTIWECKCDCGKLCEYKGYLITAGLRKSCGCRLTKQGGIVTEYAYTYASWSAMVRRCEDKRSKWYARYGARGISVYFDWLGDGGFVNFLKDMGERPFGKTLDRYPDCNGNYGPDNCRWATAREQRLNQERHQPWTTKNLRRNIP